MSTYTKDMFARSGLAQIRAFILHGGGSLEVEGQDYDSRLAKGREAIYKRLQKLCPDEDSLDEAYYDLAQALGNCEAVFTEIGMKTGARLVYQLLLTAEPEVKP